LSREGIDLKEYREAFARSDSPMLLDQIATEWQDLPTSLTAVLDREKYGGEIYAFYFNSYVPEFEDYMGCWMPMKRAELVTELSPELFVSMIEPYLAEVHSRMIEERRQQDKGVDIDAPVSDASPYNAG
jgi:hypothetical protein